MTPPSEGSVPPSFFTWKGDICSLLETVIGAAHWYLFYRKTRRLQELLLLGDEMQPEQEANLKRRGC